jgi:hypothetical protein
MINDVRVMIGQGGLNRLSIGASVGGTSITRQTLSGALVALPRRDRRS